MKVQQILRLVDKTDNRLRQFAFYQRNKAHSLHRILERGVRHSLGVALALAFDASRSIFVPIIVHVAFNASSYVITPMMDKAPGAAVPLCIGGAALTALTLFLIIYSREKKTRDDDGASRNGDNTTI